MSKENSNNIKNIKENTQNVKVLRCINIDCVFNSSNVFKAKRNTCSHPKVAVESRFADITIAICSEFRSKKDYTFQQPSTLLEVKTGIKTEIEHTPEIGVTPVEKVTTEELEKSVSKTKKKDEQILIPVVKPQIIEAMPEVKEDVSYSEKYNLTDNPKSDFLILRKFYQPYTKKGFIGSVAIHLFIIFLLYLLIVPKDEEQNSNSLQRIVVVEDLDMPKFDPPDVDKMKEEELKIKEDEKKDVRPEITPKKITPHIKRPTTTNDADTNVSETGDTKEFTTYFMEGLIRSIILVPMKFTLNNLLIELKAVQMEFQKLKL